MKRFLLSILLLVSFCNSDAQTLVVELFYNVNGDSYSALCVFEGNQGKCRVLSMTGNCWYDAYYSQNATYTTITIINPSLDDWVPGVYYFTLYGNYVVFQGYRFELIGNIIPNRDWNIKKAQYGFVLSGPSFKSGKICCFPIGASTCSKLGICSGFHEGKTITECKHCPHDSSWHR